MPARGNVVIRNAYVITMVPGEADLPNGDVRVENGAIVDVGVGLSAPGVAPIDGNGFIPMPGMVDTVMVDGRVLKRGGKLTAIDTGMLMAEASKASREVRDRAKWW